MYKCLDCKSVFDEPAIRTFTSGECGSESYEAADECPGCGGVKKEGELVCISCHSYAKRKLSAFARNFSEAILAEMDSILEGGSLTELLEG